MLRLGQISLGFKEQDCKKLQVIKYKLISQDNQQDNVEEVIEDSVKLEHSDHDSQKCSQKSFNLESHSSFEELVGEDISEFILKQVAEGRFKLREVEEFAGYLHKEVRGSFVHAQRRPSFEFGRYAIQSVLEEWYETVAYKMNKHEAINELIECLEKTRKRSMAFNLKKLC